MSKETYAESFLDISASYQFFTALVITKAHKYILENSWNDRNKPVTSRRSISWILNPYGCVDGLKMHYKKHETGEEMKTSKQ